MAAPWFELLHSMAASGKSDVLCDLKINVSPTAKFIMWQNTKVRPRGKVTALSQDSATKVGVIFCCPSLVKEMTRILRFEGRIHLHVLTEP